MHRSSALAPAATGLSRRALAPNPARGFTLIEILVVVVIIGILAALVVPNFMGRPDQAKVTAARNDINSLANALSMYRLDNATYPSTDQGLNALAERPSGFPEPRNYPAEPYIKKLNVDPWGSEYIYLSSGTSFELYSLGADGTEGGEGVAADIHYRDI